MKDIPKDTSEDIPKDTSEDIPKDTSEDIPKDTKPIPKSTPNPITEEIFTSDEQTVNFTFPAYQAPAPKEQTTQDTVSEEKNRNQFTKYWLSQRKHPGFTLSVRLLRKHFGKKQAVRGVNFSISKGEIVGFLGPNGAGKTTVFYMIVGFLRPNSGQVYFNEKEITKLPMYKRARLGISYLPQESSVFRRMTVLQNLLAILETRKEYTRKQRLHHAENLLEEFGLNHVQHQLAYTLSGGERRRTEIARAMTLNPHFLLLDEPFTGIDPKARHELKQIVAGLADKGVGVLITDHNERDTLSITDRACILHDGKIVVEGPRQKITRDVKAREIYLGEHYD